jgi:hypothetical protein
VLFQSKALLFSAISTRSSARPVAARPDRAVSHRRRGSNQNRSLAPNVIVRVPLLPALVMTPKVAGLARFVNGSSNAG